MLPFGEWILLLLFSSHYEFRGPEQGPFDFGVGGGADGFPGGFGIASGLFGGVFERAVAVQDGKNVGVSYAVESAVVENGFDLVAFGGSAAFERVDDGHRRFAFAQIAGHGLAEHAFGGGQVEDVVYDLESQAEVASVLAKAFFLLLACASEDSTDSHADGEKARRFAIDEVEMLLQRDQLTELFHLEQFAFDHLLRQFDEHVEDAEIALLHGDFEGLHVEPVAGEYAHRVAPLRVGRGTAAADLGFIDD